VLHTNLRDLFVAVNVTAPTINREEGTLLDASNAVLLDKDEGETVYIIGDEGETIEAYKIGSQVVVPLPIYMSEALQGGPDVTVRLADMPTEVRVEVSIQERLAALLDSVSTRGGTEQPSPVPLDDVFTVLAERLRPRALRAVLCNEVTARLIEGLAKDVKVYHYDAFLEGHIIGVTDPEYTGLVITDRRPRADDPPLQPGSVSRTLLRTGIIAQQRGVTAVIGQP
jgi:hypothetical protein